MLRFLAVAFLCSSAIYGFETEESVRKSVPLSSATRLSLQAEFGSINVQTGTERNVTVEVYFRGDPPSRAELDRMLHDFRLDVTPQGSWVRVNATFVHGWEPMLSFMIDNLFTGYHAICHDWHCLTYSRWLREVEYRITVPRQFSADISTPGGSISVGGLKGEIIAHTSGGSLNFDHTEGTVNGSTSGGSITLEGVAGRVKVHTSGGRINANEITGAIDASTSGGAITASLVAQPRQECRFYTSGGSIDVTLVSDARVNLDASTSGGSVSTDFPVPLNGDRHHRELRVPINGGGPLLSLHTSGGGIHVRRAGSL